MFNLCCCWAHHITSLSPPPPIIVTDPPLQAMVTVKFLPPPPIVIVPHILRLTTTQKYVAPKKFADPAATPVRSAEAKLFLLQMRAIRYSMVILSYSSWTADFV